MATMETGMHLKEDKVSQIKDVKKRIHSGKRFSYGKTVQFPVPRLTKKTHRCKHCPNLKEVNRRASESKGKQAKQRNALFKNWRINSDYNRTTQLIVSYKEGKKVPRLREPRNLYSLTSKHKLHSVNVPRWPADMTVLSEQPQHLDNLPQEPERFYNSDVLGDMPNNLKVLTKPEDGKVVYENTFGDSKYFQSSHSGADNVRKAQPVNNTDALCFESRFESGNLWKAVKVGPCDYQLWLRTDLYTNKYTQWYYFRIENAQPGNVYRFTIMNLMKSSSLYNCGMKPLMYSEQEAREKGVGWRRVGSNIKYYKNELKREDAKGEYSLYSLSWTVTFPHSRDRCYFAHCYPYTYTDLQQYLSKLSKDPSRAQFCKQRTLTRTLAGNLVYLLTITSPSKCPLEAKRKRGVVLTARVHPGETNSSWMMKGLLDYLTSDTLDAKLLRDTFVFKVIPMLNPDGVIVGNYRCSLTGRDLNRNYRTSLKEAFPSVWHTREMIKRLNQEREITLYCDFHGHSRQQNVFIYGCESHASNVEHGFKERVFPMMMSKNCEDKFCFKRCKFKVQKSKSGTGRVVMWNLGISNSYTLEATFCGSTLGSRAGEHFSTADFESMGYHLCDTLLDYCDPDKFKYFSILNEIEIYVKSQVLEKMREKGVAESDMKPSDVDLEKDYVSSESSPSGSDSSVSDGLPMQILYSPKEDAKKKKRLKTRKERNKRRSRQWEKQSKEKEPVLKDDEIQNTITAQSAPVNDVPAEARKNPRTVRQRNTKTPSYPVSHETCKTPTNPEQFNEVKFQDYVIPEPSGHDQASSSFYGQSIPQLRFSDKHASFGLAPATPASSLNRWSVDKKKANMDDDSDRDEVENNFIGRYMARQIRLTIQRKDRNTSSLKIDNAEKSQKLHRCNANYKMVATAQVGDWEGRVEQLRTHQENGRQYCARHAAMLKKENERARKDNHEQLLERKELLSTSPKVSSSCGSASTKNTHVENLGLTQDTETGKQESVKDSFNQKTGQITSVDKRSSSESNFPIVSIQNLTANAHSRVKRSFNFRGVTRRHTKAGYNIPRTERNSSSTDNGYFSFVDGRIDSKDKKQTTSLQSARISLSDNSIAQETETMSCKSKTVVCSDDEDFRSTQNLPKSSAELELEAVEQLGNKIQNLNSSSFALKDQLNDIEDDVQESLLDEYCNFESQQHCGHSRPDRSSKQKT